MSMLAATMLMSAATFGQANPQCDDLRGRPINFSVDWQTQIKPILNETFGGQCSGCHAFGGQPDFTDVGQDAIYKFLPIYVTPGDPARSFMFVKVNCANPGRGSRMPLGREALSIEQQGLIYDWIRQGAYGESPSNPIYRKFVFADGAESLR